MSILYIIPIILVAVPLLYLASIDGNYTVRRSRTIKCDINSVFDKLRDFKTWPDWSPWLMHEPDTQMTYSENWDEEGGHYSWDGKHIGAGKMTHVKFERPNRIRQQIEFIRPFKSVCEVGFDLEKHNQDTQLTWFMNGRMPFLFRFMIKRMVPMISKDYDLGLAMLNGRLDPQAEVPQISFQGSVELEPVQCLCKGFAGELAEMVQAMQTGFPELAKYIAEHGGRTPEMPRSVYHKVDPGKMYFECDLAVPVDGLPDPGPYSVKPVGNGKYFKTLLKGNYSFLELAWYSAYAHLHMYKIKPDTS
ncbi:MAG: SRPBCC family protein, partial [Thiotrichales bacterium]|nr:SRPBCC family protein [Thiotrichales bacterium]